MRPYIICHMMSSVDGRIDCAMAAYFVWRTFFVILQTDISRLKVNLSLTTKRFEEKFSNFAVKSLIK